MSNAIHHVELGPAEYEWLADASYVPELDVYRPPTREQIVRCKYQWARQHVELARRYAGEGRSRDVAEMMACVRARRAEIAAIRKELGR